MIENRLEVIDVMILNDIGTTLAQAVRKNSFGEELMLKLSETKRNQDSAAIKAAGLWRASFSVRTGEVFRLGINMRASPGKLALFER